jgi:hypothetical protein
MYIRAMEIVNIYMTTIQPALRYTVKLTQLTSFPLLLANSTSRFYNLKDQSLLCFYSECIDCSERFFPSKFSLSMVHLILKTSPSIPIQKLCENEFYLDTF